MLLLSESNETCFGYFDPDNICLDNEINDFQVDLTEISAKTEALVADSTVLHWLWQHNK